MLKILITFVIGAVTSFTALVMLTYHISKSNPQPKWEPKKEQINAKPNSDKPRSKAASPGSSR